MAPIAKRRKGPEPEELPERDAASEDETLTEDEEGEEEECESGESESEVALVVNPYGESELVPASEVVRKRSREETYLHHISNAIMWPSPSPSWNDTFEFESFSFFYYLGAFPRSEKFQAFHVLLQRRNQFSIFF